MEDESGVDSSSAEKPLSFADYADQMCPFFMSIGVPYHEYWYGDYSQLEHYKKAYEIKRDRTNYDAWLQGAYVYEAICAVSPVLHAFAPKGTKVVPYLKEPYGTKHESEAPKENIEEKVGAAKFFAFASQMNQKFKNSASVTERQPIENGGVNDGRSDNRSTSN